MSKVPSTLHLYHVPDQVLARTRALLREPGLRGFEAVVLWAGSVESVTEATVRVAIRPGQRAYRAVDGCAVEVPPDSLSELIALLPEDTFILARLHTHPGPAYHSAVDDMNMLIAHQGAISIVVPDFAAAPMDLMNCSVNELRHDRWRELDAAEVAERFVAI